MFVADVFGQKVRLNVLETFKPFRDTVLDEMLRHEGLGDNDVGWACRSCNAQPPFYLKCNDCSGVVGLCGPCIVVRHQHLPLHRVQVCAFLRSRFVSACLPSVEMGQGFLGSLFTARSRATCTTGSRRLIVSKSSTQTQSNGCYRHHWYS